MKTDNFFLIHNFNTIPENLISYCTDYLIVDASTDKEVTEQIYKSGLNYIKVENTGHNLTTYFNYFVDNYDKLPNVINLLKGNIIDRHCSKEFFEKVYNNKSFTYLYSANPLEIEKHSKMNPNNDKEDNRIGFLVADNKYIELNRSWYASSPNHPNKYFDNYDDLLCFIFKSPIIPKYTFFSPGACYIVTSEHIRRYKKEVYINLNKLMNYGLNPSFPSEAHMIERFLPTLFESSYTYELNYWIENEKEMDKKLKERELIMQQKKEYESKRFKSVRKLFSNIGKTFLS